MSERRLMGLDPIGIVQDTIQDAVEVTAFFVKQDGKTDPTIYLQAMDSAHDRILAVINATWTAITAPALQLMSEEMLDQYLKDKREKRAAMTDEERSQAMVRHLQAVAVDVPLPEDGDDDVSPL